MTRRASPEEGEDGMGKNCGKKGKGRKADKNVRGKKKDQRSGRSEQDS